MLYNNEAKLMNKYGLTFKDFSDDDWREIFDTIPGMITNVIEKYVAPAKIKEFQRDLNRHHELTNKIYLRLEDLLRAMNIKEGTGDYYDVLARFTDIVNEEMK